MPPAVHPPFVPAGAAGSTHAVGVFAVQVGCVTVQAPLLQLAVPPVVRV